MALVVICFIHFPAGGGEGSLPGFSSYNGGSYLQRLPLLQALYISMQKNLSVTPCPWLGLQVTTTSHISQMKEYDEQLNPAVVPSR